MLCHHSRGIFPCAFCKIRGRDLKQSNTIAPLRTRAELEELGDQWKHLGSTSERLQHWEEFGVRYTPLSRLPYYDVTRSKVIDSMHTYLLDGLERHINGLLGMDSRVTDADAVQAPAMVSADDLFDAECVLRDGSPKAVAALGRRAVISLCHVRRLRYATSIETLVQALQVSLSFSGSFLVY